MKKFLLFWVSLNFFYFQICFSAQASQAAQAGQASPATTELQSNNLDIKSIFKLISVYKELFHVQEIQLLSIVEFFNQYPVSIPIAYGPRGERYGFDFTRISSIHETALRASMGKDILTLGEGRGLFLSKLLMAGARHVTAVDVLESNRSAMQETVLAHEQVVGRNFASKYDLIIGDATNLPGETKVDVICAMNLLHYLTPGKAIALLRNSIANHLVDGGDFFATMDAPSGDSVVVDNYIASKSKARTPGYMMTDSVTRQRYHAQRVQIDGGDFSYTYGPSNYIDTVVSQNIRSTLLPIKSDYSPAYLWHGIYNPNTTYTNGNSGQPHIENVSFDSETGGSDEKGENGILTIDAKVFRPYFNWDMSTARYMFERAGFVIVDMYYIPRDGQTRYDDIYPEEAKTQPFKLCVHARKPN
ncbi:MAG: class I SAM-dependent methyltransferase [Oligoflexia bacterium]|nr:class I SAM-dependent methyltransferase [Oligoflexia bacterium]